MKPLAVIQIKGNQYTVREGDKIRVEKLDEKEGSLLEAEKVLLVSSDKEAKIGTPYLTSAKVDLKVLSHVKGEKIRIFKMKPKTRYRKTIGHRQKYTNIEIGTVSI